MDALMNETTLHIEEVILKKAALQFRAINHKLRQQIMQLLHHNGQMTVTKLYKKLQLEQSVASQHLSILRKARLVTTKREGKYIFYSVNYHRLDEIHEIAARLIHIDSQTIVD